MKFQFKMDSKYNFQVLLPHYWKQIIKATESDQRYCMNTINIRTVKIRFKNFNYEIFQKKEIINSKK